MQTDNYQDYYCNVDGDNGYEVREHPSHFHCISLLCRWQLSVTTMIMSKKSCWPGSKLAALGAGWTRFSLLGKLHRWKRGLNTLPWVIHPSLHDDDCHIYIWWSSYVWWLSHVWWSSYMAWTLIMKMKLIFSPKLGRLKPLFVKVVIWRRWVRTYIAGVIIMCNTRLKPFGIINTNVLITF